MLPETPSIDWRAVSGALFIPLLLWTGSVIAVSLMGHPEVVWMTPAAWLLALPVGLRVRRESISAAPRLLIEAAGAGGLLGLAQGLLFLIMPPAGELTGTLAMLLMPIRSEIFPMLVLIAGPLVTAALALATARLAK